MLVKRNTKLIFIFVEIIKGYMPIRSSNDIERLTEEMGFLPFFKNEIAGFSIEELTPSELWFSDEQDGPWEWKGPVVRNGNCAYGKFFRGKAGYVSMRWLPELVNYRRTASSLLQSDKLIYDTLVEHESLLSKELKTICGFNQPRKKRIRKAMVLDEVEASLEEDRHRERKEGFDTIITRLQMQTLVVIADFEYLYDKHHHPYGWGIARYAIPEMLYGKELILSCAHHSHEESQHILFQHLSSVLPQASDEQILHLLG